MNTLILYPDTHRYKRGILRRLHEQTSDIRAAALDVINSLNRSKGTPYFVESACYTLCADQRKPGHFNVRRDSLATEKVELFQSKSHAIEPDRLIDQLIDQLPKLDICVVITEHSETNSLNTFLSSLEATSDLPIVILGPAYPLSFSHNELLVSFHDFRRSSLSECPTQQIHGLTTDTKETFTAETNHDYDYTLHYEQFHPVPEDLPYKQEKHALAVLTGTLDSTLSALRQLDTWVQNNPDTVGSMTIVSSEHINEREFPKSVTVKVIQANMCSVSLLISMAAKSTISFVAGNGLDTDFKTFGNTAIRLEPKGELTRILPNNRAALKHALLHAQQSSSSKDSLSPDSLGNTDADIDSKRPIISPYRVSESDKRATVRSKITTIKKKWKKFNESPRRFFSDSTAVKSMAIKTRRDKQVG